MSNKENFWGEKLDENGFVKENELCPYWDRCGCKNRCRRWNNPTLKYACEYAKNYGLKERIKHENSK